MKEAELSRNEKGFFRILSIDGGGIRGIIPAAVLVEVEKAIQKHRSDPNLKLGECFDMIAGTSTGGILTCIYLTPSKENPGKARFSAADGLKLYLDNGDEIFDRSIWKRATALGGVSDEKYSAVALENVMKKYFGNVELKDLIKPCMIPAYSTKQYRPFFFTQHDAKTNADVNYFIREVARATSAAPTYFEAALSDNLDSIPNALPMIDGGVFANNPAACALVEAIKLDARISIPKIAMLSIGTGKANKSITHNECKDWGLAGWVRPLFDIFMDGVAQTVDFQLQTIYESIKAGPQYLRIDGTFNDYQNNLDIEGLDSSLDNASQDNMKRLERFGRQLARNYVAPIDNFVKAYM